MAKQNDLFSLMLKAPWHVYAFRSGAATGSSNRRNSMAAKAANKSNTQTNGACLVGHSVAGVAA